MFPDPAILWQVAKKNKSGLPSPACPCSRQHRDQQPVEGHADIDFATGGEEVEGDGEGGRGQWGAREVPGGRGMGPQSAGWGPQAMGGDFCRESEEVEALLRERMPHYRSIPQLAAEGGAGGEAVYIDYR